MAQREWQCHFDSFAAAVKDALRQDPDVILVGEMRDRETMEAALTAAETGHLVFSTLHTQTAVQTITRLAAMGKEGRKTRFAIACRCRYGPSWPSNAFCGRTGQDLPGNTCPHPCGGAAYPQR